MTATSFDPCARPHRKRILFVSQRQAEQMRPPDAALMISITDPARAEANIGAGWKAVLRISFDDVDEITFPGQDVHLKKISADQAADIVDFIERNDCGCKRIVIHCRHGISRSAAVAKAVAEACDAPFPSDYTEYNRFVYQALRSAFRSALGGAVR